MLRSVPQMFKKMNNHREQNFEGGAKKKILDEATRIVNVFLIS